MPSTQQPAASRSTSFETLNAKEKKRLQNRIAQRTYRQNQKQRVQALEDAVAQAASRDEMNGAQINSQTAESAPIFSIEPQALMTAPTVHDFEVFTFDAPASGTSLEKLHSPITAEEVQLPALDGIWSEAPSGEDLPKVRPALHRAAGRGDESMCRLLIERGAEIGKYDSEGRTALHVAVVAGHVNIVRQMLEKQQSNVKDMVGRTALFAAVQSQNEGLVRLLLDFNVDINSRDFYGEVALHLAVEEGLQAIVSVLLERGADINA